MHQSNFLRTICLLLCMTIVECAGKELLTWNSDACKELRKPQPYKFVEFNFLDEEDLLMKAIICWHNKHREILSTPTYLEWDFKLATSVAAGGVAKMIKTCDREIEHEGEAVFFQQIDDVKYFGDKKWSEVLQDDKLYKFLDTLLLEQGPKIMYNGDGGKCNGKMKYDTVEYEQMFSPVTTLIGCYAGSCGNGDRKNFYYVYCYYSPKLNVQEEVIKHGWSDQDIARMRGSKSPFPEEGKPSVCEGYDLPDEIITDGPSDDIPNDDGPNPSDPNPGDDDGPDKDNGSNSINAKDTYFITLAVTGIFLMLG